MTEGPSRGEPLHVLLDADGVLQRGDHDLVGSLSRHLGLDAGDLVSALRDAESASLVGADDVMVRVAEIVPRFTDVEPVSVYLHLWERVAVDPNMGALVDRLRSAGYGVHLGTNQHERRAARMRTVLGHDERFDVSVYSCDIGSMKPDREFFRHACEMIQANPSEVLFVNDLPENVAAAEAEGLDVIYWNMDQCSICC